MGEQFIPVFILLSPVILPCVIIEIAIDGMCRVLGIDTIWQKMARKEKAEKDRESNRKLAIIERRRARLWPHNDEHEWVAAFLNAHPNMSDLVSDLRACLHRKNDIFFKEKKSAIARRIRSVEVDAASRDAIEAIVHESCDEPTYA